MTGTRGERTPAWDLGAYCRRVEEHLTRVNEGHLVRIVGAEFEIVRGWALAGVPLSVVYRGIERKAERHRAGRARRPLRLQFCEADVRAVFDDWRRAVGAPSPEVSDAQAAGVDGDAPASGSDARRRPPIRRHVDRAIEKLVRAAGRLELPENYRSALTTTIEALTLVRENASGARGAARDVVVSRLAALDDELMRAAEALSDVDRSALVSEASTDLAMYRSRMAPDAWERAVQVTARRLLRDHLGLPTLDVNAS